MHKVSPRAPSPLSVSLLLIWVMLRSRVPHCFSLSFSLRARFAYFFRSSQYARRGFSLFFCYRYIHALSFFLSLPPLNMRLKSIPTTDSRLIRGVHKEHFVRSAAALFLSSRGDPQDARGSESIRLYTYISRRASFAAFFSIPRSARMRHGRKSRRSVFQKNYPARAHATSIREFLLDTARISCGRIFVAGPSARNRGGEREREKALRGRNFTTVMSRAARLTVYADACMRD